MPRKKVTNRTVHLAKARESKKRKGEVVTESGNESDRSGNLDLDLDLDRSRPLEDQDRVFSSTPSINRSRSRDLGEHAQPSTSRSNESDNESEDDRGSENELDLDNLTLQQLQDIPDLATNTSLTRSEKKMIMYMEDDHVEFSNGRILADISQVHSLVASFPCPQCLGSGTLNTAIKETRGLAVQLAVECTECNKTVKTWWSSETRKGRAAFKVNKACTLGSLSCGMGARSLQRLCENFDLPCLHHKSFQQQADKLYSDTNKVRDVFSKAAEIVRKEHAKLDPSVAAPETLMDIAVSYDGSWLTRGHTSLIGVGCVIDILTGLVLDVHVMSSYCQACENKTALQKEDPNKFAD